MSLNKAALKIAITTLLTDMLEKESNSIEEFANRLSSEIEIFVKSGTVMVNVATTGSATAQTGTGTGNIT
ncbi:hypothetical protein KHA90_24590 [Flavobacterium psychroterrae]|uniref:Uncharacterized protein n=1 Tax=Flavobacterium psychroterrae TaxID=2133767 RepID=A0ABS5PIM9_9FLAO|nr:hypothetical protein [Flavobacterium psychroterrae]MBS7234184.1 hypothetical protein [Flavobacterium psychroterrae]